MGFEAEIDNSERCDVLDNLRAEVICSICCSIFEEPMKLDCCDGHLCKKCFDQVKNNSQNCPLCRTANFTAKFSRLMVTVLSQYKLFCPAGECNASVPYSNFARHKETCPVLNRKPCSQCNEIYSKNGFQKHFSCFEELNKKVSKLESDVEEASATIEQLISTNESERRESSQKIKMLEERLKKEEEKNQSGNQGGTIQRQNEELEKIKNELGNDRGAGHVFEQIDERGCFNEEAVRRVLRGLEAGLTEVNFKFGLAQNLEVSEAGWYFRQQTWNSGCGEGDFWKMTLTKNGRRIDFKTDAEELMHGRFVRKSEKNLRPGSNGMVKFKSDNWTVVRWNVTIEK